MKSLSCKRSGYGAIRTDEPGVKSELLSDWQSERVPAPGDERDLNPFPMSPAQGGEIGVRDLKLRVEQRAVNVYGKKADGRSH